MSAPTIMSGNADESLRAYIRELEERLWELENSVARISYVAPTKLREGMLRIADGAEWDPGSGAGLYRYQGAAWTKIG